LLENLSDIGVTEYGTIIEEIELICCMTGFSRRCLVHHVGEVLPLREAGGELEKGTSCLSPR
jgi:hypothetical protein